MTWIRTAIVCVAGMLAIAGCGKTDSNQVKGKPRDLRFPVEAEQYPEAVPRLMMSGRSTAV